MKALVTGGTGFVGSALIRELLGRGIEVAALMRRTSSDANLKGLAYERREGDITDLDSLRRAVADVDLVFHLAGLIKARDWETFHRFNGQGTENVARAVSEVRPQLKRLVYVSSLAAGGTATPQGPRREQDPDAPVSHYGESKRAGEVALEPYVSRLPIAILRPPMVYGPRDTATLVLIQTVAKRIIPRLPSRSPDGEKHYSVVHVDDLARAIADLGFADASRVPSGSRYYVCSEEDVTSSRLMGSIAHALGIRTWTVPTPTFMLRGLAAFFGFWSRVTGRDFHLSPDKVKEILPDYWTCSHEQLTAATGYQPRVRLEAGMTDAVRWYRENGWI